MKKFVSISLMVILLSGCAISRLPCEAVKTVGTTVQTAGKVVETTGKVVVSGAQVVGKVAEAGGKLAETAIKTPGVKDVIINKAFNR
ncbi:MAG: hypothetical protein JW994_02200 [Candidatus Omnitrophica bacterium]|nr:hypothetical protein [Candidatus Omnitrophota bacterium]